LVIASLKRPVVLWSLQPLVLHCPSLHSYWITKPSVQLDKWFSFMRLLPPPSRGRHIFLSPEFSALREPDEYLCKPLSTKSVNVPWRWNILENRPYLYCLIHCQIDSWLKKLDEVFLSKGVWFVIWLRANE
jgi:hypothetical protein